MTMSASYQALDWQKYYDRRFRDGYADHWPADRYRRLAALLRSLAPAHHGTALDFGCGNGSFSQLLADSLPGWQIVGADVSQVALENAARAHRSPRFVQVDRLTDLPIRYDLIFSHHVLEHVPDLEGTLRLFDTVAKPHAAMLLVLPCGNPGSLQHRLCLLRTDGIDATREDRFFCDDEPHLRRLTSRRLSDLAETAGFRLTQQYYGQHFWGQVWPYAQKSLPYLWALTDLSKAKSIAAAVELLVFRAFFIVLALASWPTLYRWRLKPRAERTFLDQLRHAAAIACSPISTPVTRALRYLDGRESDWRRDDCQGAEMFLTFVRDDKPHQPVSADYAACAASKSR